MSPAIDDLRGRARDLALAVEADPALEPELAAVEMEIAAAERQAARAARHAALGRAYRDVAATVERLAEQIDAAVVAAADLDEAWGDLGIPVSVLMARRPYRLLVGCALADHLMGTLARGSLTGLVPAGRPGLELPPIPPEAQEEDDDER
jgi:hypothetical protein